MPECQGALCSKELFALWSDVWKLSHCSKTRTHNHFVNEHSAIQPNWKKDSVTEVLVNVPWGFQSSYSAEQCVNSVRVFWSVFFSIQTEHGDLLFKSSFSVIRENTHQKKLQIGTLWKINFFILAGLTRKRTKTIKCSGKISNSLWQFRSQT